MGAAFFTDSDTLLPHADTGGAAALGGGWGTASFLTVSAEVGFVLSAAVVDGLEAVVDGLGVAFVLPFIEGEDVVFLVSLLSLPDEDDDSAVFFAADVALFAGAGLVVAFSQEGTNSFAVACSFLSSAVIF